MIKIIFTLVLTVVLSPIVAAAMQPMTDEELGIQTGQAFFQIDRDTSGSVDFTKFTFGMDIDISMNSDLVELGRYDRAGEAAGSSDIRINDFALGSVNNDGTLNPFRITDPFFELAFEDVNGKEELVGIRLGFGSALGKLSGNIESLTGNLQVDVRGRAKPIRDQASGFVRFLLGVAGVGDNTMMESVDRAVLLNPVTGEPDSVRAVGVGLANGNSLQCVDGGCWLNDVVSSLTASNCAILGISTCFRLNSFRTLDVGKSGNPATGMFLSFQTKSISWIDNGVGTPTVSGAFMNIPNGGITVDFEQSFNGIERIRTKFLDPYYD
ncbi:hypothetical protein [Thalassolituus sp. UBA2009]|uniref:hypothetical protein n=1 Tax=Thalassolituus sp. UBA2009 TaxID=1947658 RepID=UPI00257BCF43|nr:hypothetical protein [Thalassolituus sp. UBA2009]